MTRMWESPKYRFRVPVDPDDDGHGPLKEVVIDVTGSAPSFEGPGVRLGGALQKVLKDYAGKKLFRVLDVGAGKLRNTVHVLKERTNGHVWAVEYEALRSSSRQAQVFYKTARGYKTRFHDMSFPHQFLKSTESFDLILLINVLSVMPVPAERLLLLKHCFERLRRDGRVFWYSQHGEPDYAIGGARCNDKTRCGDGFHIGGKKYEKTFFREFSVHEVDEMMLAAGFSWERTFPVERNLARVYKKRPPAVLTNLIEVARIEACLRSGANIPDPLDPKCRIVARKDGLREVIPTDPYFRYDSLCVKRLEQIGPGNKGATAFHRLAELILRMAFRGMLDGWKVEKEVNEGRERIDLFARNRAESGFFDRARDHFGIRCPYVSIECKNYSTDVGNNEFNQLSERLNPQMGQLGIMVCRKIKDQKDALARARDRLKNGHHIIILTDPDLIQMCEAFGESDMRAIDDLLEEKLQALIS